jgi:hypothetical protein
MLLQSGSVWIVFIMDSCVPRYDRNFRLTRRKLKRWGTPTNLVRKGMVVRAGIDSAIQVGQGRSVVPSVPLVLHLMSEACSVNCLG